MVSWRVYGGVFSVNGISMDISKFSDPDFDVKEWVNGALRLPKDSKTSVDVSYLKRSNDFYFIL